MQVWEDYLVESWRAFVQDFFREDSYSGDVREEIQ